jgi:hypothetical protein
MSVAAITALIIAITGLVTAGTALYHSVQTRSLAKPAVDAQSARDAAVGAMPTGGAPPTTR